MLSPRHTRIVGSVCLLATSIAKDFLEFGMVESAGLIVDKVEPLLEHPELVTSEKLMTMVMGCECFARCLDGLAVMVIEAPSDAAASIARMEASTKIERAAAARALPLPSIPLGPVGTSEARELGEAKADAGVNAGGGKA